MPISDPKGRFLNILFMSDGSIPDTSSGNVIMEQLR